MCKGERASGRTDTEGEEEEPEVDGEQAMLRRQLRDRHGLCPLAGLVLLEITSSLYTQTILELGL